MTQFPELTFPAVQRARLTPRMLEKGTQTLDSVEFVKREERNGESIQSFAGPDTSNLTMDALSSHLPAATALFADVVRHPAFRPADLERQRAVKLADLARIKTDPREMAARSCAES